MRVGYSLGAEARIEEIIAQLSSENPSAAASFLRTLERAQGRLASFPRSGPRIPEYPSSPCREFLIPPFRFFYFVDERRQLVWILEIWHGAQQTAEPRPPAW